MTRLAFIGGGKMAEALIAKLSAPSEIVVSDINPKRLVYLKKKYKVKTTRSNAEAFAFGQVVILAVKPQDMEKILRNSKFEIRNSKLAISIAAGIPLSYLQKKLPGLAIVRAMPNNPCLAGKGITALAKGKKVSAKMLKQAKAIFEKVGKVEVVPEKLLDAITGLSGSGPAFVYQTIEALENGGIEAGLPRPLAAAFARQTVWGAAATVVETGLDPQELRKMVTSPGGTTIEGLKVLKKGRVSASLAKAVKAAAKKSKQLAKKWTS
ncbi:MAG: pyrroline-5-carboxylate reductase [bacterium]